MTNQSRTDVLESSDILPIVEEHYHKIAIAMRDVMNTCSPEIVADIANEGAHICGGSSKIAGLDQFLTNKLSIPISVDEQADFIEVVGAGKLLSDARTLKEILYYL
ncbi:MAG: rod shape-determining protein [Clostridia bacterium]|nr:rod shape-determining protein [Clostridia bacterium]